MRKGKVSENIVNRSVIKTIKYKNRDYILTGASPGGDASVNTDKTVISSANAGLMFDSTKCWFGTDLLLFDIKRAFYNALNNVAAQCGMPRAVLISLILPKKSQEQDIKNLMRYISGLCREESVEIAGGDTEVTENVKSPVINFTAFGEYRGESYVDAKTKARAGMDIVLAGHIAMSGTAAIVHLKYDELLNRFQKSYVELALRSQDLMSSVRASVLAAEYGVRIMHDLSRGGIHSALWEMAEKTGFGVSANIDDILIRQETVEVCERYNINPYKLLSNGAVLMVTRDGENLCERLRSHDICAVVIGKLEDNNDKVILKNDEKRYIDPPKGDEIYQIT